MPEVVIVGGGVSGLAVGFALRQAGVDPGDLLVLEGAPRPGGHIRAEREAGFTVEAGPNGFLDNSPPTLELAERLGLAPRLYPADGSAAVRFLYTRGRLRRIPAGPGGLLTSGLLPLPGALRVFAEPLIPKGGHPEESVFDFAARRIGRAAAAGLVDAMVSGVFAGDARALELGAAFPKMAAMEAEHGGLVRAMIALKRKRRREGAAATGGGPAGPSGHLTSFRDGFEELPLALAASLGPCLRTGAAVEAVDRRGDGWVVGLSGGGTVETRAVVLACPAPRAAALLRAVDPGLAGELGAIPLAGIAVVATGYEGSEVGRDLTGFGFLAPRGQGLRSLGCLWDSSIWPARAPEGRVLLRTMIGGVRDPEAVDLSDEELLGVVAGELERALGLRAAPVFTRVFRHRDGIAQYPPGHTARLGRLRGMLAGLPGLFVSGSSYGGISVNACVAEAPDVARRVLEAIGRAS
jgi:oxygen-dependent protoporphyrinogen oxidase